MTGVVVRALQVLVVPAGLIALWWYASAAADSFFFPPLSTILAEVPATWFDGRLTDDVLPSLARLLAGYVAALLLGVAAGVVIGAHPLVRSAVEPLLELARATPPAVLIPVLMLFLGIGDTMKVVVIGLGCIWPILLNTVEGVRGLDDVLRDTASCYRLRWWTRLTRLVLPGTSPQIAAGARQALSIGIILMVISEMFAASNGVGFAVIQFQRTYALVEMWTGIILLGVIGITLSLLFQLVERRALAWHRGLKDIQRGG
ncbi:ABC transporter permease [Aeromicrobium sp. CTD01-1L150]|uniref:ABC transporter permease n=1 Tax=Aeromicrobium sp. CTD01-1L150 TaxID=3341830 RepID=UPI0035C15091